MKSVLTLWQFRKAIGIHSSRSVSSFMLSRRHVHFIANANVSRSVRFKKNLVVNREKRFSIVDVLVQDLRESLNASYFISQVGRILTEKKRDNISYNAAVNNLLKSSPLDNVDINSLEPQEPLKCIVAIANLFDLFIRFPDTLDTESFKSLLRVETALPIWSSIAIEQLLNFGKVEEAAHILIISTRLCFISTRSSALRTMEECGKSNLEVCSKKILEVINARLIDLNLSVEIELIHLFYFGHFEEATKVFSRYLSQPKVKPTVDIYRQYLRFAIAANRRSEVYDIFHNMLVRFPPRNMASTINHGVGNTGFVARVNDSKRLDTTDFVNVIMYYGRVGLPSRAFSLVEGLLEMGINPPGEIISALIGAISIAPDTLEGLDLLSKGVQQENGNDILSESGLALTKYAWSKTHILAEEAASSPDSLLVKTTPRERKRDLMEELFLLLSRPQLMDAVKSPHTLAALCALSIVSFHDFPMAARFFELFRIAASPNGTFGVAIGSSSNRGDLSIESSDHNSTLNAPFSETLTALHGADQGDRYNFLHEQLQSVLATLRDEQNSRILKESQENAENMSESELDREMKQIFGSFLQTSESQASYEKVMRQSTKKAEGDSNRGGIQAKLQSIKSLNAKKASEEAQDILPPGVDVNDLSVGTILSHIKPTLVFSALNEPDLRVNNASLHRVISLLVPAPVELDIPMFSKSNSDDDEVSFRFPLVPSYAVLPYYLLAGAALNMTGIDARFAHLAEAVADAAIADFGSILSSSSDFGFDSKTAKSDRSVVKGPGNLLEGSSAVGFAIAREKNSPECDWKSIARARIGLHLMPIFLTVAHARGATNQPARALAALEDWVSMFRQQPPSVVRTAFRTRASANLAAETLQLPSLRTALAPPLSDPSCVLRAPLLDAHELLVFLTAARTALSEVPVLAAALAQGTDLVPPEVWESAPQGLFEDVPIPRMPRFLGHVLGSAQDSPVSVLRNFKEVIRADVVNYSDTDGGDGVDRGELTTKGGRDPLIAVSRVLQTLRAHAVPLLSFLLESMLATAPAADSCVPGDDEATRSRQLCFRALHPEVEGLLLDTLFSADDSVLFSAGLAHAVDRAPWLHTLLLNHIALLEAKHNEPAAPAAATPPQDRPQASSVVEADSFQVFEIDDSDIGASDTGVSNSVGSPLHSDSEVSPSDPSLSLAAISLLWSVARAPGRQPSEAAIAAVLQGLGAFARAFLATELNRQSVEFDDPSSSPSPIVRDLNGRPQELETFSRKFEDPVSNFPHWKGTGSPARRRRKAFDDSSTDSPQDFSGPRSRRTFKDVFMQEWVGLCQDVIYHARLHTLENEPVVSGAIGAIQAVYASLWLIKGSFAGLPSPTALAPAAFGLSHEEGVERAMKPVDYADFIKFSESDAEESEDRSKPFQFDVAYFLTPSLVHMAAGRVGMLEHALEYVAPGLARDHVIIHDFSGFDGILNTIIPPVVQIGLPHVPMDSAESRELTTYSPMYFKRVITPKDDEGSGENEFDGSFASKFDVEDNLKLVEKNAEVVVNRALALAAEHMIFDSVRETIPPIFDQLLPSKTPERQVFQTLFAATQRGPGAGEVISAPIHVESHDLVTVVPEYETAVDILGEEKPSYLLSADLPLKGKESGNDVQTTKNGGASGSKVKEGADESDLRNEYENLEELEVSLNVGQVDGDWLDILTRASSGERRREASLTPTYSVGNSSPLSSSATRKMKKKSSVPTVLEAPLSSTLESMLSEVEEQRLQSSSNNTLGDSDVKADPVMFQALREILHEQKLMESHPEDEVSLALLLSRPGSALRRPDFSGSRSMESSASGEKPESSSGADSKSKIQENMWIYGTASVEATETRALYASLDSHERMWRMNDWLNGLDVLSRVGPVGVVAEALYTSRSQLGLLAVSNVPLGFNLPSVPSVLFGAPSFDSLKINPDEFYDEDLHASSNHLPEDASFQLGEDVGENIDLDENAFASDGKFRDMNGNVVDIDSFLAESSNSPSESLQDDSSPTDAIDSDLTILSATAEDIQRKYSVSGNEMPPLLDLDMPMDAVERLRGHARAWAAAGLDIAPILQLSPNFIYRVNLVLEKYKGTFPLADDVAVAFAYTRRQYGDLDADIEEENLRRKEEAEKKAFDEEEEGYEYIEQLHIGRKSGRKSLKHEGSTIVDNVNRIDRDENGGASVAVVGNRLNSVASALPDSVEELVDIMTRNSSNAPKSLVVNSHPVNSPSNELPNNNRASARASLDQREKSAPSDWKDISEFMTEMGVDESESNLDDLRKSKKVMSKRFSSRQSDSFLFLSESDENMVRNPSSPLDEKTKSGKEGKVKIKSKKQAQSKFSGTQESLKDAPKAIQKPRRVSVGMEENQIIPPRSVSNIEDD